MSMIPDPAEPSSAPQPPAEPSADDPSISPLDRIVDDYEPHQEALDLAIKTLESGITFEETHAKLMEIGWSESDAQDIVEEARIATQETRGVYTRDQVLRNVNNRYGRSMNGGWLIGFPVWSSFVRLMHSLANMGFLRGTRSRESESQERRD
jgi:hypothetical protein